MALDDFAARWRERHPSDFEVIVESACDARLHSLRCEPIGRGAFRLWRTPPGDGERFERLISERLPASLFVAHGVESSQPPAAPPDR